MFLFVYFREMFGNEDLDSKVEAVRGVSMLLQVLCFFILHSFFVRRITLAWCIKECFPIFC